MENLEKKYANLKGVEQSMLITLEAKAQESRDKKPLFRDEMAEKTYDKIKSYKIGETNFRSILGTITRTYAFDEFIYPFLKEHPDTVFINIGAGLDTRFYRVDNGKILWYNLDLPAVMALRNELIPEHERVFSISNSVFESEWTKEISEGDRPVFIILEGVVQFFEKEDVEKVLKLLANRFPNAYVLMDLLSEFILKDPELMKKLTKSDVVFKWGVKDPKEVEELNKKYNLIDYTNLADRVHLKKKVMKLLSILPKFRKMNSLVALYEISD